MRRLYHDGLHYLLFAELQMVVPSFSIALDLVDDTFAELEGLQLHVDLE